IAVILIGGIVSDAAAQSRDPFAKPGWARKPADRTGPGGTPGKANGGSSVTLGLPPIDSRIDYYKRIREVAAANGQPLPKVTSVLSLSEMAVIGIFKTPRGYAAMVEAVPIKLSYTIYPGEKFFDGQLVAVEENRLVFRKVSKMSNGKFVSTVENKTLRKFTDREQLQGTAAVDSDNTATIESPRPVESGPKAEAMSPVEIVSPFDEMNKQTTKSADSAKPSKSKKPTKVARKGKN
ncbi:MAG: hypothetical protein ACRD6X_21090, partial [Pyrinomonadaceae bacterium]